MANVVTKVERWGEFFANVATVLGVIGGIIVLLFTYQQIRDARKALESTTVYSIQKDGREMVNALRQKEDVFDYLTAYDRAKRYPAAIVKSADLEIGQIIQFHSSLFNQHRNGVITDRYWRAFEQEISNFARLPPVTAYWTNNVLRGAYNDEFKQFGRRILR